MCGVSGCLVATDWQALGGDPCDQYSYDKFNSSFYFLGVCVCVRACVCVCMRACVYMSVYTCECVHASVCVCWHMGACMHT